MLTAEFKRQAEELGRKAARARYRRDDSLASFMRECLTKLKAVVERADRAELETIYCDAYREEYQGVAGSASMRRM